MAGNTRPLNNKLHELYPFVPPPYEKTEIEDYEELCLGTIMFQDWEAEALEALKVAVWKAGGPRLYNAPSSREYDYAQVKGICYEGHDVYAEPWLCVRCDAPVCSQHSGVLLGKRYCNDCMEWYRKY